MAKAHFKQNMGGAPAAVEAFKDAPTPNVVVFGASPIREELLEQLEELAAILRRRDQDGRPRQAGMTSFCTGKAHRDAA